jgi:hypothetical protein
VCKPQTANGQHWSTNDNSLKRPSIVLLLAIIMCDLMPKNAPDRRVDGAAT